MLVQLDIAFGDLLPDIVKVKILTNEMCDFGIKAVGSQRQPAVNLVEEARSGITQDDVSPEHVEQINAIERPFAELIAAGAGIVEAVQQGIERFVTIEINEIG